MSYFQHFGKLVSKGQPSWEVINNDNLIACIKNKGFPAAVETFKRARRRTQADSQHDQVSGKDPVREPEGLDGGQEEGAEVMRATSPVKDYVITHAPRIIPEE